MQARILGFQAIEPAREFAGGRQIARLTIACGPLLVRGVRLALDERGLPFVWAPATRHGQDRVVFQRGPERDQLLAAALNLHRAITARPADLPLATAPKIMEPPVDPS